MERRHAVEIIAGLSFSAAALALLLWYELPIMHTHKLERSLGNEAVIKGLSGTALMAEFRRCIDAGHGDTQCWSEARRVLD